ncbi:hypothetical protein [Paenibacillus kobensis]|uniref:hypothetical protein n=1 Tax=Paenibacillus kobensis TaxID=59841 RepID=UPI000FD940ED|nr:hypothetical protein [Paenibacillus kobensis]
MGGAVEWGAGKGERVPEGRQASVSANDARGNEQVAHVKAWIDAAEVERVPGGTASDGDERRKQERT